MNLHDWIDELCDVLDLETEVDEGLVLDLARVAAHNVVRPAAPITTYLLGYAAGSQDASPEQIEALAVPRWKKTVLHAMADYGMIMGDTGSGSWAIQAESGSTYTSFGYEDELVKFARANGWSAYNGRYSGNLRDGVDWARYLRVLDPCVSQGTC